MTTDAADVKKAITAALLLATALLAPDTRAEPTRKGTEIRVNSFTYGSQFGPDSAMNGAGEFIVVWQSLPGDGDLFGLFGRRFDSTGAPLDIEFDVNTYTTEIQSRPRVAMDPNGGFVIVWESFGQDGDGQGVFGQLFDSAGMTVGYEFPVNATTAGYQLAPDVAVDPNGSFLVVWDGQGQDASFSGIAARLFDSTGSALTGEFVVNVTTYGRQRSPSVASTPDGGFVVAWQGYGPYGSEPAIYGRVLDGTGAPVTGEFVADVLPFGLQKYPSITATPAGDFVVVWQSSYGDGDGYGIFGQLFDGYGSTRSGRFQVNSYTSFNQTGPSVAASPLGGFVVTWQSYGQDGSGQGVIGRLFGRHGTNQGDEFQVAIFTTYDQRAASVATSDNGEFVVAWESYGQDGYGTGIAAQRFGGLGRCGAFDEDGDGLGDTCDMILTSPLWGEELNCSNPADPDTRPVIRWSKGRYDRYRAMISWDPGFIKDRRIDSGSTLLTKPKWKPGRKKWRRACNRSGAGLYIRVFGVDRNVRKTHVHRRTFSDVIQVVTGS